MFSVSHCSQQPRTPDAVWSNTSTFPRWTTNLLVVLRRFFRRISEWLSLHEDLQCCFTIMTQSIIPNSRGSEVTSLWSKAQQVSRCPPTAVPGNSRQVIYWQADSTCRQRQEPHPSNNICVYELLCRTATAVCDRIGGTLFVCKLQKPEASKLEKYPGRNTGRENRKPAVKYPLVETLSVSETFDSRCCALKCLYFETTDRKFVRTP